MDLSQKISTIITNKKYVCVKLSGGADSAIIYYALCDVVKDTKTKIIVTTLDTTIKNQNIASAKRVIKIVKESTGVEPYKHITNIVKDSSENYVNGQQHLLKKIYKKYTKNIPVYSGLTINPPQKEMIKFVKQNFATLGIDKNKALLSIDTRDKSRDNKLPYRESPTRLFEETDKKGVMYAYNHYDMMENLYPYTVSCTEVPHIIGDNKLPIHCGVCFPCLERQWAFGRLI